MTVTATPNKVEWDYTVLADAYLKRPEYSDYAIEAIIKIAGIKSDDPICDIGAGTAHLTLELSKHNKNINAIEPNDAMRNHGINRTKHLNVKWHKATGEVTNMDDNQFKLVTFGSSFNVTNRQNALKETYRILKTNGWFACMWNHRNLNDPIQQEIENIFKANIEGYSYGTRREDQTNEIKQSNLFKNILKIEGEVTHEQKVIDCIEAWRSHATLQRQAGNKFHFIIEQIEQLLINKKTESILVPYTTRIWLAQAK